MSTAEPTIGQPYEIQPGDTITEIAFQAYGDARRYLDIADHNSALPGFHPARLEPGLVIEIPRPDYVPLPRGIGGMRGTVGKIFQVERGASSSNPAGRPAQARPTKEG